MKLNERKKKRKAKYDEDKLSEDELSADISSSTEQSSERESSDWKMTISEDESSADISTSTAQSSERESSDWEMTRKRKRTSDRIKKKGKKINKEKKIKKENLPLKKVKKEEPELDNGLSPFERMVQRNIEEKNKFLEKLQINDLKENFSQSVEQMQMQKRKAKKVFTNIKKSERKPLMPTRKSFRLSKVNVDLSEEAIYQRALTEIKTEEAVEMSKVLPPKCPFKEAIEVDSVYADFEADFSSLRHKASSVPKDYSSMFKSMRINENQVAKVVSSRISALAIHPMEEKIIIAAGSKYGSIGLWNVDSEYSPSSFSPHIQGITNLKFNPEKPSHLISSSYDGIVRCADLEKMMFNEVYNVSDKTCCTFFDFLSATTYLVAQKNGDVCIVDNRSEKISDKKINCHDYTVKSVSVHPVEKNYFVSADVKGLLRLWDLRKIQRKPIVENHHHKRCVQSAYFSPLTGKHILTTSADDTVCIFDSSKLGQTIQLKKVLKHNNHTGRWLTPFKATWLPGSDSVFSIGSMAYPRKIEVFDENTNIFNFQDEYLACITSLNVFHPSKPIVAGANSSGKVFVFAKHD